MPDLEKIEFTMKERRRTTRKVLFDEQLGGQEFSDTGLAIGVLYVHKDAVELLGLGKPAKIKVTIEPA